MTCPDTKGWYDTQEANDCVSSSKWNAMVLYLKDKIRNLAIDAPTALDDKKAITYDHTNTKFVLTDILTPDNSKIVTNKTIDADNNTISNLAHGSEVDNPSSGVHGVTGDIVGTTDIQTLTNKTLTTPTVGNFTNATHTHADAINGGQIDHANLTTIGTNTHAQIDSHIANVTTNPHSVDKADVGLGNVDNTSDLNKPISTATQTALDAKVAGPASSTDSNIAIFNGITGKIVKDGGKSLPTGDVVGTSDTQTLSNKTLTTPTIGDFTYANHNHSNAVNGGVIDSEDVTYDNTTSGLSASNIKSAIDEVEARVDNQELPQVLSYTQDEERRFFKDDFSSDTSDNYTVTGTVTGWGTGTITLPVAASVQTGNVQNASQYLITAKLTSCVIGDYLYFYVNSSMRIRLRYTDGNFYLYLQHNHTNIAGISSTTGVATDGAEHTFGVMYTDGNYNLLFDGEIIGSTVSGYPAPEYVCPIATDNQTEVSAVIITPSISDSDDFSSDTSARWAAVTGTIVYDAVNDNLDLVTASATDGKATIRRRSYLNEDGSQKINVTLPTGVDGDYFTLVTHAASADMSDGIGVGLMSDGATGWNLATLDGTTITEGAATTLSDADVATIEIEKDISGAYWYYIYDSTGAKPTTPTGKLFTTLTRGYTGFYCNGAGATTQTFTVDDYECRCNTVVGDTNCESTEEFFFRDDFGEDSLDQYVGGNSDFSISGGVLIPTSANAAIFNPIKFSNDDLTIEFDYIPQATGVCRNSFPFLYSSLTSRNTGISDTDGYVIYLRGTEVRLLKDGGVVDSTTFDSTSGVTYKFKITVDNSGTITVYNDTTQLISHTDPTPHVSGYVGISSNLGYTVGHFDNLQISGTRVYPTPMLRGTQVGLYNDGDEDIVCTTFSDDFEEDSSGEYTITGSPTWDTTNKKISVTLTDQILAPVEIINGYVHYEFLSKTTPSNAPSLVALLTDTVSFSRSNGTQYCLFRDAGRLKISDVVSNTESNITIGTTDLNYGQMYSVDVFIGSNFIYVWLDGSLELTHQINNSIVSGYVGFGSITISANEIYNIQINAISPDSPNGISYCLPAVNHGGRWDTQESVTQTIPMTTVVSADLKGYSSGISTLTTESKALRITAKNDTDDSSIYSDGTTKYWDVAMDGDLKNTRKALETNFNDYGDSVVFTHSTDSDVPDGCIYVRETIVKPITIVWEEDLK